MSFLSGRRPRKNITMAPDLLDLVEGESGRTGVPVSHIIEGRLRESYAREGRGVSGEQLEEDVGEILRMLRPVVAWMHQMGVAEGETVTAAPKVRPEKIDQGKDYYLEQLEAEAKTPIPPVVTAPPKRGWFGR